MKKMQVVILAGGLGTRLWPLTRTGPKPMVSVGGVPYLELQIRFLKSQSVKDIVILTGYLGEQIEEHFGDGRRWGISIKYSRERKPLGTGGALRKAYSLLADTFVLLYGDSYLPIRYAEAHDHLLKTGAKSLVVVYDNRSAETTVPNNIELDEQQFVKVYEKDSARKLSYVEAGVLAFHRDCLEAIPTNSVVSLEKEIFPSLIARREMAAFVTNQRFYDIGTPERLKVITEFFAHDHHKNAVAN